MDRDLSDDQNLRRTCIWVLPVLQSCDFTHLSNNCYSQVPHNRDRLGSKAKDVQGKDAEKVQRKWGRRSPDETGLGVLENTNQHDYEARGTRGQADRLEITACRGHLLVFLQRVGRGSSHSLPIEGRCDSKLIQQIWVGTETVYF